ncbi:hypothetical protein [Pseudomonas sp.]|uniref:hypothetical protein n=1 Tax=Pseudomonas sp. TaxID=306 RepID=UPI003FD85DD0
MSQTKIDSVGTTSLEAGLSSFNTQAYVINQFLLRARTATLVQVESVTNDGGVSEVGYVDVKVLVQRTDSLGNLTDSRTVYNVPYFRLQGGTNAIILDPQVGDIGLACIADRDISSVKASKAEAPPGSGRHHNMADAIYIGGILNGAPTQYVQFTGGGINVVSPSNITLKAPLISAVGNVSISTGATGTFTTPMGDTVTVQDGIVTNIF